jgi:YVTN family beta-propeller protein
MNVFSSIACGSPPMRTMLRTIALLAALLTPVASFAQSRVYVANSGSDNLSVIDTSSNQVLVTLPGPGPLTAIGYHSGNGLLYVPTQAQVGALALLDPASNAFLPNPAPLGAFPTYVTVSPELNRAYVSNFFGGVSVIDTTSGGVITEVIGFASPLGSSVDPQLGKLYVVNNMTASIGVLDTNTNKIVNDVPLASTQPTDVKIDTVLHKAFAANTSASQVVVIDVATDTVSTRITLPGRPQFIAIDSQAHRAYVTYNNGVPGQSQRVGGLAVLDTSSNQVITSFVLGNDPTRLALNLAESRLYVADSFTNRVTVLNTATNAVVTQVTVGNTPTDLAVVTPPAPKLSLSSSALTFDTQLTGTTSAAQTIEVRNTGNAGLAVQGASLTAGAFQLTSNTCGCVTLLPGGACTLSLTFTPAAAGATAASLTISSNDSSGPQTVAIAGTGETRADANIRSLTPTIGQAGSAILIRGGNFGAQQGGGSVVIGGVNADVLSWRADRIEVVAPGNLTGAVGVQVLASTGTSNTAQFTYAAAGDAVWVRYPGPWSKQCDAAFGPIATHPSKAGVIYVGNSAGCGVYSSEDQGATWTPRNNGILTNPNSTLFPPISRIAIAPGTPNTLYLGTFDAVATRGLIYRSANAGSSWQTAVGPVAAPNIRFPVFDIAVFPQNDNAAYAALEGGVFKTTDGGMSWNRVVPGNAPGNLSVDNYTTVRIAPSNSDTAYAAGFTSYSIRPVPRPGATACSNVAQILPLPGVKTTNAGALWSAITNPAPVTSGSTTVNALITDFSIDPLNDASLLASIRAYPAYPVNVINRNAGIFNSGNGGTAWAAQSGVGSPVARLVVKPDDANTVVALTGKPDLLLITRNRGVTWTKVPTAGWEEGTSIFDAAFDGQQLYATTSHGVYALPSF